jgi:hypothetical protein
MRILILTPLFLLALSEMSTAGPDEQLFDNPMFRRCVSWMLSGERGALIQDLCLDQYEIPAPSLFLCARKVQTGFTSATDQEACAIVYEEETKKVRAGYVREMPEY